MDQQITRPILWNVPVAFVVIMYALTALWTAAIVYAIWRWYRVVSLGQPEQGRFDQIPRRLILALRDSFGQGVVIRETWGWMHYSFYVAFVGLFIGTVIVLINDPSFGPITPVQLVLKSVGIPVFFYYGDFYLDLQSCDGHLLPAAHHGGARGRCPSRVSQACDPQRAAG